MKKLTTDQIRQMFLDYFKQQNHMIEPGASLVPVNDPTLLWINSGVAALKKYFDGTIKPANKRIANAQKSIRTNDIENVGKTARHHTFFEMLGNFSIGDYFKKEAIPFAWEFLTSPEWIGFEKEKMYVTVHPDDQEAYQIWIDVVGMDPTHILKTEENYWQIGEGPSGPNTEIFYDRGEAYDPEKLGEKLFFEELENDRYIEVWNVVFSQYDAKEGVDRKDFKELPQKNIDTGMGLERLACIVQEVETNFDTDSFMPIIRETEKMAKFSYQGEYKMAYRVIADHIRTVTFALSDGAVFSNDGRGYVLRRILRRAVRYGIKLGIEGAFMYRLVSVVADCMKEFYPYLLEKVEYVSKLVKLEEERFHSTLLDGEKLLNEVLKETNSKELPGDVVFKLYDTYGFPYELTEEIAEEKGYTVDRNGFEEAMEAQRERARNAREESESMSSQSVDLMNFTVPFEFVGYCELEQEAIITGLFQAGTKVDELTEEGDVTVDYSPFYAESGGQVADTGTITSLNSQAVVEDVKKAPQKQFLHHVKVESGSLKVGDKVTLRVDGARRQRIMANHSAVHLLQSALKQVVGEHIAQAGSYVADSYARFDFTHFEKVTEEQVKEVEELVNQYIFAGHVVDTELMDVATAKKSGAIALFDEKYESSVRVVSMGNVSKELCGGTHVSNTQEIGFFKVVGEESIGSGIRRITIATKMDAYHLVLEEEALIARVMNLLNIKGAALIESKVEQLTQELANTKQELGQLNSQLLVLKANDMLAEFEEINGLASLIKQLNGVSANDLKLIVDQLKKKQNDAFIFFASVVEDKVVYVVYCSERANEKGFSAGDIAKEAAVLSGGNGGGRKDIAQSGGKDSSKVDFVLSEIKKKLG